MINENIGLFELAASNPGFVNALQRVSTLTGRSPASLLASAIGVSAAVALLQPRPDEPAPPLTGIRRGVGSNGGNDPNGSKDPKGPDNEPKPPIVPIIPPLGDEGIQKPALDLPANPVLPPPGQERQTGTNANGDAIFIDSFGNTYIRDRAGNQIATDIHGKPTAPIVQQGARPDANELSAADALHRAGFGGIELRQTANDAGIPNLQTSDLLVPGVGRVDVLTPTSSTISDRNLLSRIEKKNKQANAILVQIDATPARMKSLADRTFGKPTASNIDTLFFQLPNGQIVRFDRPGRQ